MPASKTTAAPMDPVESLPASQRPGYVERRGRPPLRPEERTESPKVLSMRGTGEWRDWLTRAAAHFGYPSRDLLVEALVAEALAHRGYPEAAPPRLRSR